MRAKGSNARDHQKAHTYEVAAKAPSRFLMIPSLPAWDLAMLTRGRLAEESPLRHGRFEPFS